MNHKKRGGKDLTDYTSYPQTPSISNIQPYDYLYKYIMHIKWIISNSYFKPSCIDYFKHFIFLMLHKTQNYSCVSTTIPIDKWQNWCLQNVIFPPSLHEWLLANPEFEEICLTSKPEVLIGGLYFLPSGLIKVRNL